MLGANGQVQLRGEIDTRDYAGHEKTTTFNLAGDIKGATIPLTKAGAELEVGGHHPDECAGPAIMLPLPFRSVVMRC